MIILSLIMPVYNEQETIGMFLDAVEHVFEKNSDVALDFVFVNDGSTDETLAELLRQQSLRKAITIVDLSRNFGKEAALSAGLRVASGDVVVPIDVDLQDPPELIPQMLAKWRQGYEVVLARRKERNSDPWLKRTTARAFYRVHNCIATEPLPADVGDFRLMDRCVVDAINTLPESQRFMKGLFSWVGFRTTHVDYTRAARSAGSTKWSGWKLINLAFEAFTSFSTAPLRIWTYIGFAVAVIAAGFALIIVVNVFARGIAVPGYASLAVLISFDLAPAGVPNLS